MRYAILAKFSLNLIYFSKPMQVLVIETPGVFLNHSSECVFWVHNSLLAILRVKISRDHFV